MNRIRSFPFVAVALALIALPIAKAQQTPPLAGIAHVAIRVHDLAASIAFYNALGFEQAFDLRRNDIPYESFIKINDQQFIELYPTDEKNPQPGFLHLCFQGDDLQAIHDDYVSHGLKPIDVRKAGAGNLLFTMPGPLQPIGPGGKPIPQNIEYTQYMPGSLHSNNIGQKLGADRIADKLLGVSLAMTDPEAAREFYLNDLSFKQLPGEPMTMHLPGTSGEEVQIVSAALGTHARITLQTSNLGRAARHLTHEHIKLDKAAEVLAFTDPDGNQILVRQR
jgi:catechol 2,3-dioxygenase-like lactoylglutathione lyase family enzyme